MKLHSTMQYYMMHCMSIHLWIVTFKSIIKRSTASFCSLLTGNFVLSAEMAALVADYNADVKESCQRHPVKNAAFIIYLFGHVCCRLFLNIKKNLHGTVQKLCFLHFVIFFPQLIFSCIEWFKYFSANNNNNSHLIHKNIVIPVSQQRVNYLELKLEATTSVYCYFSLTSSIRKQPLKFPWNFRGHI